ncbi:NAD(P)H dehydrogenase (quinone) [Parelusimicrobium proximum]|uniref:NAD(P)H-dependent oxidoreductase n=1 Tax=Parelusimicrobium proximum TaxID=3228953 RepID=UPI003D179A14
MAKCLIVYAHPFTEGFNFAVKQQVSKAFVDLGYDVEVSNLYREKFNPVLSAEEYASHIRQDVDLAPEVIREQEKLKGANYVVFIYPVWWSAVPAILKGYADRVFTYGFAYTHAPNKTVGLLKDKKVLMFGTAEKSPEGLSKNLELSMTNIDKEGVLDKIGMKTLIYKIFPDELSITHENTVNIMKDIDESIKKVVKK